MTKLKKVFAAAAAAALVAAGNAGAQELKFGAMPLNTWWYVAGASVAALVQPQLKGGSIEVLARGGGIANPVVVDTNKAQIAMSNVATSKWAWDGEKELYKGRQHRNIRSLLGGINSVYVVAMLTEDYIQRTGNDSVEKALADKNIRIIMKPAGSSVPPAVRMITESLGTSLDKIRAAGGEVIQLDAAQITSLMREGRADLYFETATRGHPALTELTLTTPVRFVDLPEKALKVLGDSGLKPSPMPEWYKGQKGPVKGADLGTHIIVHKDVPEDVAYLITKTIVENKPKLVERHKAWSSFKPEEAWKPENNAVPLHPGAIKYYRERGWLKS